MKISKHKKLPFLGYWSMFDDDLKILKKTVIKRDPDSILDSVTVYEEFACSPCVCVDFQPSAIVSFHSLWAAGDLVSNFRCFLNWMDPVLCIFTLWSQIHWTNTWIFDWCITVGRPERRGSALTSQCLHPWFKSGLCLETFLSGDCMFTLFTDLILHFTDMHFRGINPSE